MAKNWKKQASSVRGYAWSRLALNMYAFFEQLSDFYDREGSRQQELASALVDFLKRMIGEEERGETLEDELMLFRGKLRKIMEIIVYYTDAFQNYEYALNRVERRFVSGLPVLQVSEEEFVDNLMRYLSSPKEAAIQNQRIQQVVEQLPVRFSRQKYYGMVHDALTSYIGSDQAGLEDMMYLLRSSGMVCLTGENRQEYPVLNEVLTWLESLSFKTLTKESYQESQEKLDKARNFIYEERDKICLLQSMVNDCYILFLTEGTDLMEDKDNEHGLQIIESLCREFDQEQPSFVAAAEKLEKELEGLEGMQEKYFEEYSRLNLSWAYKEADDEIARKARKIDVLMSSSDFASLEQCEKKRNVEPNDIEEAANIFFTQLASVFSACQKPIMRAVMARSLSCLPVFFHSYSEIQSYIQNSLGCCSDSAEKEACLELLCQIMESDGYELV